MTDKTYQPCPTNLGAVQSLSGRGGGVGNQRGTQGKITTKGRCARCVKCFTFGGGALLFSFPFINWKRAEELSGLK